MNDQRVSHHGQDDIFTYNALPKVIKKPLMIWNWLLVTFAALQLFAWFLALFVVGRDVDQGNVYRLSLIHIYECNYDNRF